MLDTHTHTNYLFRMTVLYSICGLAPIMGPGPLSATMLPIVVRMASDPVPNVRFNAAKTLQQLMPLLEASIVGEHVTPTLTQLTSDSDSDVRYFSTQALQAF